MNQHELAPVPQCLAGLTTTSKTPSNPTKGDKKIHEGERNTHLFEIGCALRGKEAAGEQTILEKLREVNRDRCVPPLADDEVLEIAKSSTRYEPDKSAGAAAPAADSGGKKSQATRLVEFVADADLFHSPDGTPYVTIEVSNHQETWPAKSTGFHHWLAREYHRENDAAPSSQALHDAINVIGGKCRYDGPQREIFVRVGEQDRKIYLDLGDDRWRVVEITSASFQVLDRSPVKFRRASGALALLIPVQGGSTAELRRFVNLKDDEDWALFLACLVAALRPQGPYPILLIEGEHGSGKSTLARIIRALVDPYKAAVRSVPRDEGDLLVPAGSSHLVALDNLSKLENWLSDALCRLATGGGLAKRELYTDLDQVVLDVQRPVVINSIEELPTRGDFLDRCVILRLPPIADENRQAETNFWTAFDQARPGILGALLNAVSMALCNIDSVHLVRKPRMADFAVWVVAAEPALDLKKGIFLYAYEKNRSGANAAVIEASVVAGALIQFMNDKDSWSGGMKDLLQELASKVGQDEARTKYWPHSPRGLRAALDRLTPNLRAVGLEVRYPDAGDPSTRRHLVGLKKVASKYVSDVSEVSGIATDSKHLKHVPLPLSNEQGLRGMHPESEPDLVEVEGEL